MDEARLDDLLSTPRPATAAALAACPGDVIVLGAGGKMGPSLSRMVARAVSDQRRVYAVSRWSSNLARRALREAGVEPIQCDLLDVDAVSRLPDAPNAIFMAGQKFGTTGDPSGTWAMNVFVPGVCAHRYRESRIVAFSTGNVYPLQPVASTGAREDDPVGPVGEYAQSCVGRERMFEYASSRFGTRASIIRLNYAIDLRYGVLVDIALKVRSEVPVPLEMGYANVIWQGDANRIAIESLARASSPPFVLNVTGGEALSVRTVAEWYGRRFGKRPRFHGEERSSALLSDTARMRDCFEAPSTTLEQMLEMTADWIDRGQPLLGKPTHFEARDGRF